MEAGESGGVVFAWWGSQAKGLKKTVEEINKTWIVPIEQLEHPNPGAQGESDGHHFQVTSST